MAIRFLSSQATDGSLTLATIANATTDTDKFLVSDSGIVKYRTGAEVRSDIGAGTGDGNVSNTGTPVDDQIAIWTNATTIEGNADFKCSGTGFIINDRDTLLTGVTNSTGATLHIKQNSTLSDRFALLVQSKNGGGDYKASSGFYADDSDNMELRLANSGNTNKVLISSSGASYLKGGAVTFGNSITVGSDSQASINLQDTGTTFLSMFKSSSNTFIQGGTTGNTIYFGAPATYVQNVNVQGLMDADNYKIDGDQGTSGQVMTSSGSGVSWTTPSAGANDFLTALSFDTSTGVLTGTVSNQTDPTVDLDGRYFLSSGGTIGGAVTIEGNVFMDDYNITSVNQLDFGFSSGYIEGSSSQVNFNGLSVKIGTISNATTDTDKFLVSDSGVIKYRTGAELRSDIGAGTGSGTVTGTGTAKNLTMWATGGTGIEDSPIKTATVNTLNQITVTNGERIIVDKPSSVTSGDPAFQIAQDGTAKTEFGWDDDGGGFAFVYNYSGNGIKLGAAGNNPMVEVVTTTGAESVNLHKQIEFKDYGSGTYAATAAYTLGVDSLGNVVETAGAGGGTVTGTGSGGRVAFWNSTSNITSEADFGWSGQTLQIGGSANASEYTIELGKDRTNNGYAYIDFIGDTTYTDYGLRIIRGNSGANTSSEIIHRGTGNFALTTQEDSSFKVQTNGANERFKIRGNGEAYFGPDGASTSTLYIDTANRKVGFRTETPGSAFDVNGTFRARNELNIGATTEQNFFVSGSSPYYVKMGDYTPSNANNYMGGETQVGLVRSTAGFGSTGKVLMDTRYFTTQLTPSGWPTANGASNGVQVTPSIDNDQLMVVRSILITKQGFYNTSGWGSSDYPVEFVQQKANGAYGIIGGVAEQVLSQAAGTGWVYEAYQNLYNFSNGGNEELGFVGKPLKLSLSGTNLNNNKPQWFITVQYSLIDNDIRKANVDQTL